MEENDFQSPEVHAMRLFVNSKTLTEVRSILGASDLDLDNLSIADIPKILADKVAEEKKDEGTNQVVTAVITAAINAATREIVGEDDRLKAHQLLKPGLQIWDNFLNSIQFIRLKQTANMVGNRMKDTLPAIAAVVLAEDKARLENGEQLSLWAAMENIYHGPYCGPDRDEMRLARGTGFLIRQDLLLTAAHNLFLEDGEILDKDLYYAFDFRHDDMGATPGKDSITWRQGKKLKFVGEIFDDWMLVHFSEPMLDRPVLSLSKRKGHPDAGTPLYAAGFPLGTPLQVAPVGEYVVRLFRERFNTDLDLFKGNSGSPFLNLRTNKVEGILVSGYPDLTLKDGCHGLKVGSKSDVVAGYAGEQGQPIATIRPRINEILAVHNIPLF